MGSKGKPDIVLFAVKVKSDLKLYQNRTQFGWNRITVFENESRKECLITLTASAFKHCSQTYKRTLTWKSSTVSNFSHTSHLGSKMRKGGQQT